VAVASQPNARCGRSGSVDDDDAPVNGALVTALASAGGALDHLTSIDVSQVQRKCTPHSEVAVASRPSVSPRQRGKDGALGWTVRLLDWKYGMLERHRDRTTRWSSSVTGQLGRSRCRNPNPSVGRRRMAARMPLGDTA